MAVNNAWADAIGKVLHSEPKCKSVVLAKAKKDKDRNLKRPNDAQEDVQIVKADGTVVDVQDKTDNKSDNTRPKKRAKLSRHEWDVLGKTKPKPEDNDRERMLCAIATKGVVQLFNAVREQQTTIESKIKEVGTSETKREKAMSQFDKKQFLDKLKGRNDKNEVFIRLNSILNTTNGLILL